VDDLVEYDGTTGTFALHTPTTTYAVRLTDAGPRQVYWGPRLTLAQVVSVPDRPRTGDEVLGEELPGEGGERFGPPSVRLEFADGTRAVEWRADGHAIDGGRLTVTLVDLHYPVRLDLHYQVYDDGDVVERWAALTHLGETAPIVLERLDSAAWTLPPRADYRLSYVVGEWAAEFQLKRTRAAYGETTWTSRRGTSRHQGNPWLSVDPGDTTEEYGEVWSTALAWSGTWKLTSRRTLADDLVVTAGAGQDGLRWRLAPGETWTTPVAAGLYTRDGFGGLSRRWHDYARRHVLSHPDEVRPVLYNSWEGTWFDVTEANQREIAAVAADLGVELFVMDDGWFGRRLSDSAGLGDWWPNPDRFPAGLTPLVDEVHRLGMRFGIWVEPEMVNPDSDLYRSHPEWTLHLPNRFRTEVRTQLVLNFARPDVAEWAHGWLDRLLTEHRIDFLKWDMNRAFTEAGWADSADPHRLWYDHTRTVYAILDRLRADHPHVRIESCASGGGRADFGVLRRTDQVWTSDNTDPVDRIAIQDGYSQVYPATTMGAWASENPNPLTRREIPLRFRFHVAMAGALGVSGNLRDWSKEDRVEAAAMIVLYKRIRHVVQHGVLHRLTPPTDQIVVVQYVNGDETVIFAWRPQARHGHPTRPVRLRGLDPEASYREGSTVYSGAVLAGYGLDLDLPPGDYASVVCHLTRVGR